MIDFHVFQALATAVGLGLLVGLQRQRVEKSLAGIRTLPLVTVFGTLCGLLAERYGGLLVPLGLLAVVALVAVEDLRRPPLAERPSPGITTEAALLVMYAVGAWLAYGAATVALAVTGTLLVLLYAKQPLHRFVQQLGESDLAAIVRFVVIALIVLPLLPNRGYGPFQVLNPFQIWLMVVLIVGLNLAGYIGYRILNTRAGTVLGGVLGGVVSSTATTFSYTRQTRSGLLPPLAAALVITLASTVVYARVLAEIGVVASKQWALMAPPLVILLLINLAIAGVALLWASGNRGTVPQLSNPAELRPALVFGGLYALVLLAAAALKHSFGDQALYLLAIVSGLTDVDAITLSTARLVSTNQLAPMIGWRLILCATLANLGFKLGIVALLGTPPLLRRVVLLTSAGIVTGVLLLAFWPDSTTTFFAALLSR